MRFLMFKVRMFDDLLDRVWIRICEAAKLGRKRRFIRLIVSYCLTNYEIGKQLATIIPLSCGTKQCILFLTSHHTFIFLSYILPTHRTPPNLLHHNPTPSATSPSPQ